MAEPLVDCLIVQTTDRAVISRLIAWLEKQPQCETDSTLITISRSPKKVRSLLDIEGNPAVTAAQVEGSP